MKKAFEKFRKAKQYIAEKNTAELTKMVRDIIETSNHFNFIFDFDKTECFEDITNHMIVSELFHARTYNCDFIPDDELISLCKEARNILGFPVNSWNDTPPFFDHHIMSLMHPEKRLDAIKIILNTLDHDFSRIHNTSRFLTYVVWYAAFEDDDAILEGIFSIIDDHNLLINNVTPDMWLLMYIEVIINKNRYDLLDKIIPMIFETVDYDFTHFHTYIKMDMSYSELVYLLYKRYYPKISDGQIVEQLVKSYHFSNLINTDSITDNIKAELEFITHLNFKTNAANCILALWALSDGTLQKEYLYGLLSDKPVLYLDDNWLDLYAANYNTKPENYKFMLDFLKDNPSITLSIDNNKSLFNGSLSINNSQLNQIFSICKPTITDKIADNKLINNLIGLRAKQIRPLLKYLELDPGSRADLIGLCVEYKNLSALNFLNNSQ